MPESTNREHRPVKALNAEVARKIAAGEVIDRPNAIVRELMDNAVDSGATEISVEIKGGGIEQIRVVDDGCGMTREDLENCARPHATSKIQSETDLLRLTTLGFRGEALSSMAAVSRLQITSGQWKMNASVTEDHLLTAVTPVRGTIVQTSELFANFPARRLFLKRPASEGNLCRSTFEEKVLPRPDISFRFISDGEEKLFLPKGQSLKERFVETFSFFESQELFYSLNAQAPDKSWSFELVIGEPAVSRSNRKDIYIFVNGRRIQEYSLVQAIEYGSQGYFPNGTHPVACLFVTMDPALVDFNIHPAKREARFKDISAVHHAVSSSTKNFFRQYTVKNLVEQVDSQPELYDMISPRQDESFVSSFSQDGRNSSSAHQGPSSYQTSGIPNHSASYGSANRDKRSSFFLQSQKQAQEYADKIASLSIAPQDASVEGRTTRPNYLPDKELGETTSTQNQNGFHFVGSALGNFLIAEKDDVLYIIDQHAAHERYLYNQIIEKAGEKQELLVPYTVQTDNAADDNYIRELCPLLEKSGFTPKDCGDGLWEFSSVPIRWKGSEADLARDLLDRRVRPNDMINAVAASTACRSAVMDGDVLDTKTAAWIAEQALLLPDPHCPHGRPVYTTITRRQLFSLVKRI